MAADSVPQYWCRATTTALSRRASGFSRLFGKRSLFQIHDQGIVCGALRIAYGEVERARVIRTRHWFLPVTVLRLRTRAGEHRFQFNPWATPEKHLNLVFEEIDC